MRIRRKMFASVPQPQNNKSQEVVGGNQQLSSKDLQLEQMRLQRQLMQNERMKQKLQAEERRDKARRLMQQQRLEQRKDMEEDKERLSVRKMENDRNNPNVSLYKTKPHPTAPVPMK